jgi:membrane protein implicated in regulation of membrane protease activity
MLFFASLFPFTRQYCRADAYQVGAAESFLMEQYVYLGCFAAGLFFTVLSFFFGHVGAHGDVGGHGDFGGHDNVGTGGHAEAGYDQSGMPGMSIFSPTVVCAFITAFGAFGMIFSHIEATRNVWISMPLSLVGGLAIAFGIFYMFVSIFRHTQSSSESHVAAMLGRTATIITPIPPAGVGEIAYVQGGTRYTAPARTVNGSAIGNGQTVKITRVAESQFYVEPV